MTARGKTPVRSRPRGSPSEGKSRLPREEGELFVLRLYVAGPTRAAGAAVETVRAFCDQYLSARYDLEVIDIYQQPALAKTEQIVATPTLVKLRPEPLRRFIGKVSNPDALARRFELEPRVPT